LGPWLSRGGTGTAQSWVRFLADSPVRHEDVHYLNDTSAFVELAPVPGHLVLVAHEVSESKTMHATRTVLRLACKARRGGWGGPEQRRRTCAQTLK